MSAADTAAFIQGAMPAVIVCLAAFLVGYFLARK